MIITKQWIRSCSSAKGGWTKDQFALLGIDWPPKSGWAKRLIGRHISEEIALQFRTPEQKQRDDIYTTQTIPQAMTEARMRLGLESGVSYRAIAEAVAEDRGIRCPASKVKSRAMVVDFVYGKSREKGLTASPRRNTPLRIRREIDAMNAARSETFWPKVLPPQTRHSPRPKLVTTEATSTPPIPAYVGDVTSNEFLQTYAWRRLRMTVLTKRGARCECCGAMPKDGIRINVDHIKPRKRFPELALVESNLQVLCEDCNHGKGNWDQTDWREPEVKSGM